MTTGRHLAAWPARGACKEAAAEAPAAVPPRRRQRARVALLGAGLLAAGAAASAARGRRAPGAAEGSAGPRWTTISPATLLDAFERNAAYMRGAGWLRGGDGSYLPGGGARGVQLRGEPGHAHVASWQADSASGCGPARVRAVLHVDALVEGVDPVFVAEVLLSPHYGLDWNPGIRDVVLRRARRGGLEQDIPKTFYPRAGESAPREPGAREAGAFGLLGQVTEIPLPPPVEAAIGRRFTADWVASRFECGSRRGFTVGTSANTSQLAGEAGVEVAQDLCMSAVLVAPWEAGGRRGTVVHMVSHVDPHLPSALRSITLAATASTLRSMLQGVGRKAWEVQQTGLHPEVHC